jgi:PAS domain S-box-containing protein
MRILIVDDHEMIRRGIRSFLLRRPDIDLCGEAVDGQDAIEKARDLKPDLILMDISMPRLNGLDATREIRRILPQTDVLVLSQHDSPEMMREAAHAGARGYIVKSSIADDLLTGIDKLRGGQTCFDPAVLGSPDRNLDVQEVLQRSAAFETALRESEELFRMTFEHAAVGIAHVAENGRWLRINQKLCDITGYTREELQKLTFQDITYPADLAADLAQAERVASDRLDQYAMQKRYIRRDGSLVWVNLTVGAVRDPERRLKYFISVVEDITAQKEAEKRLVDSEERLQELVEYQTAVMNHMAEGLYTLDAQGLLISINPAAEAMFGWTRAELLGRKMHDVTHYQHPDGSPFPASDCPGLQVLRHGIDLREHEDAFIRKDGSFLPVVFSASPLRREGKIAGVIVGFRDDTAHRRAREALLHANRELEISSTHLQLVTRSMAVAVTRCSRDFRYLWANQGYADWLQRPLEEIIGKSIVDVLGKRGFATLLPHFERVLSGERVSYEEEAEFAGIGSRWISATYTPTRDASSAVDGWVAVVLDITDRKHSERALAGRARQQKALFHLADELHRAGSVQEVYAAALNATLDALQCHRAAVLLCDDAGNMRFESWRGLSSEYCAAVEGHSAWKPDVTNPQPVWISDVNASDLAESLQGALQNEGVAALAFLPLMLKGRLGGKLMAYFNAPHSFTGEEIETSLTVARQLAFAIERMRGTEALRESEERLRLAHQVAHLGTFEWDIDKGVNYWSPELEKMYGLPPGGFAGSQRAFEQLVHPDDRDKVRRLVQQALNEGDSEGEWRIVWPDGSVRWMLGRRSVFKDEHGKPQRMIGVNIDVTERKKAHEALQEAQTQLALALESSRTAMFEWDIAERRGQWNPPMAAIYEFNPKGECITAEEWMALFHPDDRERLTKEAERAWREDDEFTFEFRTVPRNGKLRWMLSHGRIVRDGNGKALRMIGTHIDITDRKLAEAQLAAKADALAKLAAIIDSSEDAIVTKNLDGIITSWNKGAERLFGYSAGEAIGQSITLIIPSDRSGEERSILERLRRGERIEHFETVRRRKDGSLIDISITISPVKDSSGHVIGASKVARDISRRKRAEEALRRSEDRYRTLAEKLDSEVRLRTRELEERNAEVLRQASQLRDLSRRMMEAEEQQRRHIARELHDGAGQLLAALGMNLEAIHQDAAENAPPLAEALKRARQLVQQLTREIRTMSYLLHPPLLEENGLPAALRWYAQGLTERSTLDVTLDIPKRFGRLPRDLELVVFRVIQECLTNVHRHSGSKTVLIRIARAAKNLTVTVQDHGKGIPPEKLAELQSRGSGDSGVGIPGMRERVRQFGGEFAIESNDGGTTVLVTIPIAGAAAFAEPGAEDAVEAS